METVNISQTFINQYLKDENHKTGIRFKDKESPFLQIAFEKNVVSFYFVKRYRYLLYNIKIGQYPYMSPFEARQEVFNKMLALTRGITHTIKNEHPTLNNAIEFYLEKYKNNRKAYQDSLACFDKFKTLFRRELNTISFNEISAIHKSLSNIPVMANHAVKKLSTAIKRYIEYLNLPMSNPCIGIEFYREKPRKRFLNDNEAPRLIEELERLSHIYRYRHQAQALLLMLYTGQRKSNVLAIRDDEIENGIWTIPASKAKAGREIIVPLNSMALNIIQSRKNDIKDGWFFPSLSKNGKVQRLKSCRHTFYTACQNLGIKDCHIHDLRRTLGSWMLINGSSIAEVSRTLGHSSIAVTEQVYAHLLPSTISAATENAINAMKQTFH